MPELPEVEAARRAIEESCVGKRIKRSVVADDSKVIDGVSASDFQQSLAGKTIVAAHRKGKNLWLQLDSPPFPSFQFGMAGAVYIKGVAVTKYKRSAVKDDDEWPSKYSKVFVELEDGMEFSFTDKRRFAKVRLLKDPTSVPPISELGPDALLEPMDEDGFVTSLSKKKLVIKALLLDQSYISGIGNWIADEVLYQAKIHPLQVASSLSKESCAALQKCIKEVVNHAVEVDADSGRFPDEWLFHFRWGKKVIEKAVEVGADSNHYPSYWVFHSREKKPGKAFVDGKEIEFITAGGRTTAFVPEVQKLSGDQAANQQKKQSNMRKRRQDDEESENDEENAKARKGVKSRGQVKKKQPAKRNPKESKDDEPESDSENTEPKKGTQPKSQPKTKKLPAKRKAKGSGSGESDGVSDEDNATESTELKKVVKSQPKRKVPAKGKS